MTDHRPPEPARRTPGGVLRRRAEAVDVEDLFAGACEIRLIYRSEEYRLRITRNRKLILTK